LVAIAIKVHLDKLQKKTSSIRRGFERSHSYLPETFFCRSWHLPSKGVAVVSKGRSLNHSG